MLCRLTTHLIKPSLQRLHNDSDDYSTSFYSGMIWCLRKEEKLLFYKLIDSGIFCQHYKCMELSDYSSNLDMNVARTVRASLSVPRRLKELCRLVIRYSMYSNKVSSGYISDIHICHYSHIGVVLSTSLLRTQLRVSVNYLLYI